MFQDLVDILFGCWHSNYSFPLTAKTGRTSAATRATGTYVVCLDCGREFPYDWRTMKVLTNRQAEHIISLPVGTSDTVSSETA